MAVGWSRDGSVQAQIDANVEDAVNLARSRLPTGESLTHCESCGDIISEARRNAICGVRLCVNCQSEVERHHTVFRGGAVNAYCSRNGRPPDSPKAIAGRV